MASPIDPDAALAALTPDRQVTLREVFGIDSDMLVPAFSTRDPHVPDVDEAYRFDPQTTLAIAAGFAHHRRG
jgi:cobaltochelatase CobS